MYLMFKEVYISRKIPILESIKKLYIHEFFSGSIRLIEADCASVVYSFV